MVRRCYDLGGKMCRGCAVIKPVAEFAKRTLSRGNVGLTHRCKACNKAYREKHRARVSAAKQAWAQRNPERAAQIKRNHFLANKERSMARIAAWKRAHPEARIMDNLSRRIAHKNATPVWANEFFISEAYDLARERSRLRSCGVKWSVDHIIPLRNPLVCGLHTHGNLRVIPALDNVRKGNRL